MGAVDIAREGICHLIASGELKPGQRLPGEVELAAALGVAHFSSPIADSAAATTAPLLTRS